jgi:amidohydrolase
VSPADPALAGEAVPDASLAVAPALPPESKALAAHLDRLLAAEGAGLVAFRRDLHAHPELSRREFRTTERLVERLRAAGLEPRGVPGSPTGLTCDIGRPAGPTVGLRADLDALSLPDDKTVGYRSTVPGVCHACGHDVHTTVVLGAALALAGLADSLPGRVRLIFQPAEEVMPGGALDLVRGGALDGVDRVLALHCDPRLPVGRIGTRVGAITAAADQLEVRLTGPGGHTARPHLTADLVYVMGKVLTEVPAGLSRLVDPRVGMSLTWGAVSAGEAHNAVPRTGMARGTLRVLDRDAWQEAPELVRGLLEATVAPYGAEVELTYVRGVPPVVNDPDATALLEVAALEALGPGAAVPTEQSLGGEDFAWLLERVPGALGRLGTRTPGAEGRPLDLHSGLFDVDETAIDVGVRVLTSAALLALRSS